VKREPALALPSLQRHGAGSDGYQMPGGGSGISWPERRGSTLHLSRSAMALLYSSSSVRAYRPPFRPLSLLLLVSCMTIRLHVAVRPWVTGVQQPGKHLVTRERPRLPFAEDTILSVAAGNPRVTSSWSCPTKPAGQPRRRPSGENGPKYVGPCTESGTAPGSRLVQRAGEFSEVRDSSV
jgi:hypothetical protein